MNHLKENKSNKIWIEKTLVKNRPDRKSGERALGHALWSPKTGIDGRNTYKNMLLVKPGDLIIHLIDNLYFAGISIVEQAAHETTGLQNTPWDKPSYLIKLSNYTEFNQLIPRELILNKKNEKLLQEISANSEVFYNKNLSLRQGGYLTPCSFNLFHLINAAYINLSNSNIPLSEQPWIPNETDIIQKVFSDYPKLKDEFHLKTNFSGLSFTENLIIRLIASLTTKPFVILTGLSGSGKTKLAQSFVQWISSQKNQFKIIPVGADWTNREPLLGYPNGLDSNNYVTPDSGALQLIMEASKDENMKKPYFLILDEMNLSHVERYFADFLSIMESKDSIKLYSGDFRTDSTNSIINCEINWPSNLFIIGTVNIDETTYMFSPKVLDRANVIEFRISENDMSKFFEIRKEIDMCQLFIDGDELKGGAGQNMSESFLKIAQNRKTNTSTGNTKVHVILNKFFVELQKVGAEFGYRTAAEIELLIHRLGEISTSMTLNEKIDIAIMQKLLPKLHGSRKKLVSPLETLAGFCLNQKTQAPEIETAHKNTTYQKYDLDNDKNANWEIMYPISFEKIQRMRKNVIDNGFTSYAEA